LICHDLIEVSRSWVFRPAGCVPTTPNPLQSVWSLRARCAWRRRTAWRRPPSVLCNLHSSRHFIEHRAILTTSGATAVWYALRKTYDGQVKLLTISLSGPFASVAWHGCVEARLSIRKRRSNTIERRLRSSWFWWL